MISVGQHIRVSAKRKRCATLLLAFALGGATEATAQAYVVKRPIEIMLRQPVTSVALEAGLRDYRQESQTGQTESENSNLAVRFDVSSAGYVYHPALLTYEFSIEPSFSKITSHASGQQTWRSDSEYLNYDISTTWLEKKPYTFKLLTNKGRSELSNPLQVDTIVSTSNDQGRIDISPMGWASTLRVGKLKNDYQGYYSRTYETKEWSLNSRKRVDNRNTDLSLRKMERETDINGLQSPRFDLFIANLRHRRQFEDGGFMTAGAAMRDNMTAKLSSQYVNVYSLLSLDHPLNFTSQWQVGGVQKKDDRGDNKGHSWSGAVSHQLYENLRTSVGLSKDRLDNAWLTENQNINSKYTRAIPWGQISLGFGKDNIRRTRLAETPFLQVFDEAYTFDGMASSVMLNAIDIDVQSIVVLDEAGLEPYDVGLDYVVEIVGGSYFITRNSLGRIADGATILVSYVVVEDIAEETEIENDTVTAQLSLGGGFAVYGTKQKSFIQYDFGLSGLQIEDGHSDVYGIKTSLLFGDTTIEVRDVLSPRSNYKQTTFRHRVGHNINRGFFITGGIELSEFEFRDTKDYRRRSGLDMAGALKIGRTGQLQIRARLQVDESPAYKETRWGAAAEYDWRYGAWFLTVNCGAGVSENAIFDSGRAKENSARYLRFSARRTFR